MSIPELSEADIRAQAAPESFSRGLDYYRRGAVGDLSLRGDTLQAEVEGSQYSPYRIRISFEHGDVATAECTCPYDWGGWCKHIVAVLLKALYEQERIESRPTLETLLAGLDGAQLKVLLLGLAERDANLADVIERQVALLSLANAAPQSRQASASPRRTSIEQETIRQQVRFAMRSTGRSRYDDYRYDDDYDDDPGEEVVAGVRPLLQQAERFVEGGDAHSALSILEAITEEYIDGAGELYERYEEMYGAFEGAAADFFGELSEAWAEAILSADLDDDERDEWGEKIAGWRDDAEDLGQGEAFDLALTAAEQGWADPQLRRVLQGEITERGAWAGEAPDYADELAQVRLRILERQGRRQEYLYLAEAEGQLDRYVAMLAKMGRAREAVEEGLRYLAAPSHVLEVAKILREQGDLEGALRLAEHGLALKPPTEFAMYGVYAGDGKDELAEWTAELAAGMGAGEGTLRVTEAAFRAAPSLSIYVKAQQLAGESWATVKPGLLEDLRRSHDAEAKVDIFLQERLFDDAIAAVEDGYGYRQLERVMDAVVSARPDWVIRAATTQAERIMDAGQAQHYQAAVNWLRRAHTAYRAADRESDWWGYLSGIRAKHGRKYKLMGLIDKL